MSDLKISNITPAVGNIKTGSTNVSKIYCGSTLVWPPTSIACVACSVGDVPIGTQIWTGCNLSVTTYSDGITPIPEKYSLSDWAAYPYGAWCWYGGATWCKEAHGRLYNWAAIKGIYNEASLLDPNLRKSIAPAGYHVPTDAEWTILSNYLSGAAVAGGKMKATGTIQGGDGWWDFPNTGATNESGFTAIAGGAREDSGVFFSGTNIAWFWSSSEDGVNVDLAIGRSIGSGAISIFTENRDKGWGMSVRLIKNSTPVTPAITTSPILSITQTTAVSGGSGIVDGGSAITAKGVCWSTTQNPTIALPTKTNDGTGTSTFASNITGLTAGITYYVRAYITNSVGVTTYGNQLSFMTTAGVIPTVVASRTVSPYFGYYDSLIQPVVTPNPIKAALPTGGFSVIKSGGNGQYLFAVSTSGNSYSVTKDYGASWSSVPSPQGTIIPGKHFISKTGQTLAYVTSTSGSIYVSNDYGDTFITVPLDTGIGVMKGSNNGQYIICSTYGATNPSGKIFISSNYGLSFTNITASAYPLGLANGDIQDMFISNDGQLIGLMNSNAANVSRLSQTGGNTWVNKSSWPIADWNEVGVYSDNCQYIYTTVGLTTYISSDFGNTFAFKGNLYQYLSTNNLGSMVLSSNTNGFAYISTNFGATFSIFQSGGDRSVTTIVK